MLLVRVPFDTDAGRGPLLPAEVPLLAAVAVFDLLLCWQVVTASALQSRDARTLQAPTREIADTARNGRP